MTVAPFKVKNKFADRGGKAEKAVQNYLTAWASRSPYREFSRLVDTKAAGRTIKAAAADFEFFCRAQESAPLPGVHGLIEVKETQHDYRLGRDRITQLGRLRKRHKCGGLCFVLVHHSETGQWRCLDVEFLMADNDKGSWDLRSVPQYPSVAEALSQHPTQMFEVW